MGSEDGFCEGDQGSHCPRCVWPYVFRGQGVDNAFVSFPNYWKHLFEDTAAIPFAHSTRGQPTNIGEHVL
jgi:hypothetical protein